MRRKSATDRKPSDTLHPVRTFAEIRSAWIKNQEALREMSVKQRSMSAERALAWIRRRGGSCTDRDLIKYRFAKTANEARKLIGEMAQSGFGTIIRKCDGSGKIRGFQIRE